MSLLIIGGDSRLSKRILENYVIKYSTSRSLYKRNKLFLDLSDTNSFEIPKDVDKCLIIGGPVSYAQANENRKTVRDIHEFQIPLLVNEVFYRLFNSSYRFFFVVVGNGKYRGKKSLFELTMHAFIIWCGMQSIIA